MHSQQDQNITQDVVLIGGGHSHAIVLKQFGMNPIPGIRLTLITDVYHTPYSGMLPGYIAGLYDFDEVHIDLRPLTQFAQGRIIHDQVIGLNLAQNQVLCSNHPPISFDILSINIGSTPNRLTVAGAEQYAIAVKPISKFLQYWDQIKQNVIQYPQQKQRLAIVGGGAGGVELTLSVQAHLQRIYDSAKQPLTNLELHLFHRGKQLIPERHPWVGKTLQKILSRRGVNIHLNQTVSQIIGKENSSKRVYCESGLKIDCDHVFWVTQAGATAWLKQTDLVTDERGFIQVKDTLQSISHPHIFAAGDVATIVNHPRPKAGVFAVRQGKPLFDNLIKVLQQKPPQSFIPQQQFLILIGTGDEKAIASRDWLRLGPYSFLWKWKDYIDRKFMDQFRNLSIDMNNSKSSEMHCNGCGAKVGHSILQQVLNRIPSQSQREDILIGLNHADDAAVIQVPNNQIMVQTVDYFKALIDDPYLFGKITANHCLNDLFAMGATPQSALAIVTLPYGSQTQKEEILYQLLLGATEVLNTASAVLVGGHTTEDKDLAFGLTCNGLITQNKLLKKQGLKPGNLLILTKALGIGTLFAADMNLQCKGRWIQTAIESMLLSNQAAADCFQRYQATACTDITGFGLIGHLLEIVKASKVTVELSLEKIAILPGAAETIQQGFFSSIYPENLQASQWIQNLNKVRLHPLYPLLFDPQTSGGLLVGIPAEFAEYCLQDLRKLGYHESCIIGQVQSESKDDLPIIIH
ncbi:MAG: selenide, water dikinase SelD [Microcoleaceae cyanobacterium]